MANNDQNPDLMDDEFDMASDEQDTAFDDESLDDLGGDDWDDVDASDALNEPKPKKKSATNLIIVLVGAIAALGVVYFQFLKPSAAPESAAVAPYDVNAPFADQAPQPTTDATATPPAADAAAVAPPADQAAAPADAPQGFMTDPSQLVSETPPADTAATPATAPTEAATTPLTPMPDFPTAKDLQKADDVAVTPPAALDAAPPPPSVVPQDHPVMTAATPLDVPPTPAPTPDAAPSEVTPEPTPLPTPTPEAAAPADMPAAPSPTSVETTSAQPPATTLPSDAEVKLQAELTAAQARIADLEKQVADARAAQAEAEKRAAEADKSPTLASPSDVVSVEDDTPAVTAAPAPKQIESPTEIVTRKARVSSSTVVKAEKITRWELRSAQEGSAMIGKPGESDLKTIQVGETVPGLGRITAIEKRGEGWVVQGTQARLTQRGN